VQFQPELTVAAQGSVVHIAIAEMNQDGHLDVILSIDEWAVQVFYGNGDGSFQSPLTLTVGTEVGDFWGAPFEVVDLNGDGWNDIVATALNESRFRIFLSQQDGTFSNPVAVLTMDVPFGPAGGDFNRDGRMNIAVTSFTGNAIQIFYGDGAGSFTTATMTETGSMAIQAMAADFNGDGFDDLAWTAGGSWHVFLNTLELNAITSFPFPWDPRATAIGPLNPARRSGF
jgi:hypothetical protein